MHIPVDYMKQKVYEAKLIELKGKIKNSTIVGEFNTPLSIMVRMTMQKINKETEDLNNTIHQLDLKDIYINKSPTTRAEYLFFSNAHGTFSRINHILGHKRSLNK